MIVLMISAANVKLLLTLVVCVCSGRSLGGVPSASRRLSCSLEVMAGLRAKCHARSQSTQQSVAMSTESSRTSPCHQVSTPTTDAAGELPPDILQSRAYLLVVLVCTQRSKHWRGQISDSVLPAHCVRCSGTSSDQSLLRIYC